jgi:hypothetical protein
VQDNKQLVRVFRNTYEYTTVEVDSNHPDPERYVRDQVLSGIVTFTDSEIELTVIPERNINVKNDLPSL